MARTFWPISLPDQTLATARSGRRSLCSRMTCRRLTRRTMGSLATALWSSCQTTIWESVSMAAQSTCSRALPSSSSACLDTAGSCPRPTSTRTLSRSRPTTTTGRTPRTAGSSTSSSTCARFREHSSSSLPMLPTSCRSPRAARAPPRPTPTPLCRIPTLSELLRSKGRRRRRTAAHRLPRLSSRGALSRRAKMASRTQKASTDWCDPTRAFLGC
mmetsp:Transcript_28114/g.54861  ORF Transcript_28114/g.54861 Transcript_28114/m.54861 type:complete len:215 (+) Transcript_28114:210-854(+)